MSTELQPLLQQYYEEMNPEKRKALLDRYTEEQSGASGQTAEDSGPAAQDYRRALYEARYYDKKHPDQKVDRFLWCLMTFLTIQKNPGFFPKHHRKHVLSAMQKMQVDDRPLRDEACREVLYRELRNAVRLYYSTCSDPSYGRTLFGMIASDEGARTAQRCKDIWGFSYGIAGITGLNDELDLLCRAANDEYCVLVPEAESLESACRILNPKG